MGTENVWDERVKAYRTSAPHAGGPDLDLLVEWAGDGAGKSALDVGTGGGHLAKRLEQAGFAVTTCDPAPRMQPDVICRAEELPFPVASFDLVATRLATHHFEDVGAALAEMARVAGESVLIEDLLFVDERVEQAEKLRDDSHVRALSLDEWRELCSACGLTFERAEVMDRQISFQAWLDRCGCEGEAAERARELVSHRLDGDNYASTVFLLKGVKG